MALGRQVEVVEYAGDSAMVLLAGKLTQLATCDIAQPCQDVLVNEPQGSLHNHRRAAPGLVREPIRARCSRPRLADATHELANIERLKPFRSILNASLQHTTNLEDLHGHRQCSGTRMRRVLQWLAVVPRPNYAAFQRLKDLCGHADEIRPREDTVVFRCRQCEQ